MDEQLDLAPCVYLIFTSNWEIIEMNQTLKTFLHITDPPVPFKDLLTVTSRIYFETFFTCHLSTPSSAGYVFKPKSVE